MLSEKKIPPELVKTRYGNEEILEQARESNTRLEKQLTEFKQKYKVIESKTARSAVLTKPKDLLEYTDVTVTRLLSKRFPGQFNEDNYRKSIYNLQIALLSLSALLVFVSGGWLVISNTNFLANGNFVYNAGLLGGFLMLCSIFYALMKRIRFINALGHNETWYYAHLFCGIAGPLLILFHTSFQIKSINSGVAFFTMLTIMVSGMFGRYIYTLMSYQAHRTYNKIGEIELALISALTKYQYTTPKSSKNALRGLMVTGLKKPRYWILYFPQLVKTLYRAMRCHMAYQRDLRRTYKSIGKHNGWDKKTLKSTIRTNKQLARRYVANILKLSAMNIVQNILVNWRMIHANLLYLLTLTATAHILAVHMY
ncbi:MAG: hypothetical protein PVJ39_10680 [Gammaproteobacteria bacterium]|jgi:hypothetical protein